jgi:hypothetical protein
VRLGDAGERSRCERQFARKTTFYGVSNLFEGLSFELTNPFRGDAEFLREVLEESRPLGQAPCLQDTPLALVELGQRCGQGSTTDSAFLELCKMLFLIWRLIDQIILAERSERRRRRAVDPCL